MTDALPTFLLPACPRCSSRASGVRGLECPFWKYAHNTSAKRGRRCYFFVGCRHAREVCAEGKIVDGPQEWNAVEAAWAARREALFTEQTGHWAEAEREAFRLVLEARPFLPGSEVFSEIVSEKAGQQPAPSS